MNQPHLRGISLELTRDLAAKHLEPLKGGKVPIEILVRGKDTDQNAKHFEKCLEIIKEAGKRVGVIAKDNAAGKFIDEWKAAYGQISKDVEEVDISVALSMAAFAIKDEHELVSMRSASRACTELLANYFVEQMSEVLDSGKKVSHRVLADKIDKKLDEEAFFKRKDSKLPADFDNTQLDLVYGPIVQSGGAFDIKLSAQPDDKPLQAGVILAGIGMKYKTYCSILARTYLVDPTPAQETNYNLLHSIRDLVIKEAQEGVVLKDLYNKAISLIRSKKPELERHFVKSIGNGIGLEVRDSTLAINAKNTRTLKDGMTLCISLGFTELENPKAQDKQNKTYALLLTDTIRVKANKERAGNFTAAAAADQGAISFYFNDDAAEEQPKPKPKSNRDDNIGAVAASNITNSKLRDKQKNQPDESAEARRRAHQKELATKKQKEGLEQYSEATGNANGVSQKKFKKFESYKRDNQFPSKVDRLEILVDHKALTVIFPIMGRPVPFHINTIKNASKSDEGDYSFLRINFLSPGQGVGRKDDQPFEDPNAHFVRSMTFRSSDTEHLENISQQITELRKNAVRREQEKKDLADVVEQDKLVEIRSKLAYWKTTK